MQFTRRFRAAHGCNPIEHLTQIRLEKARKLLVESSRTLDEIAAWSGLVWLAITAGRAGRDGDGLAWLWLALASLGAVVVLAAAFVVGGQLVRGESRPRGGKHR